jgi:predicted lipid-binding transport protein (Tim44 family)
MSDATRTIGAPGAPRRPGPPAIVVGMRRLAALVPALALLHAPHALAAAGGGSSGFGGGGGRGFSGGARGFSGGGGPGGATMSPVLVVVVIFAIVLFVGGGALLAVVGERRRRRRRDARSARTRAAALEAAQDDDAFAPDRVRADAAALFGAVQQAWTARDEEALGRLCGDELLVEWRRRLADLRRRGWHNQVRVVGEPQVHFVGLVNRETDDEDRAVVLIEATLSDMVVDRYGLRIARRDRQSTTTRLREYWTLAKRDGRWTLGSIEQLGEGDHNLDEPLVASPWGDDRLRDDAILETGAADAAPSGSDVAALVDLDFLVDGRRAALDLSLVDGRFAPQVLEVSARRAVAAWADAVDGADDALEAVADPQAVAALLYPRGERRVRRVVRGPRVMRMTLVALDGERRPPRMVVQLELGGRRYLEDRDTVAVLDGSRERDTRWTERWSFELHDAQAAPWVLADASDAGSGDGARGAPVGGAR